MNKGKDRGIQLARMAGSTSHADVLETLKGQLLIVFLKRLGGYGDDLIFPVAEIDATGGDLLEFMVDDERRFHFTLRKKA